jgi:hypothetical protein
MPWCWSNRRLCWNGIVGASGSPGGGGQGPAGRGGLPVASEVRDLIRQTCTANPLWGAPRIHGELLKLGIEVSQATVGRYMPWRPKEPSPTWRSFLRTHMTDIADDRSSPHSGRRDRESRIAVALDPKRSIPRFAARPSPLSDAASLQRGRSPCSRAG